MSPFVYGLYKFVKYAALPYTWLALLLGLLAVLALGPMSPRRLRRVRFLAILAFLVNLASSTPIVARTMVGLIEQQYPPFDRSSTKRFDAIVVLAGGIASPGSLRPVIELSSDSMERTMCGVDLFVAGFAPQLVVAGGKAAVFREGSREGEAMRRLALRLGVPPGAIVVEGLSRNTYENAVETRRLLGPRSILLVTSANHIPRALALFRKQGFDATPAPCGYLAVDKPGDWSDTNVFDFLPHESALHMSTSVAIEMIGTLVYRLSGKL